MPVLCEEFMISSLRPYIIDFIQTHSGFADIVLFEFFQKYVKNVQNDLKQIIPELSLQSLYSLNPKIKWEVLFHSSVDLFNRQKMLEKIENFDEKQQIRIMKYLNKFFEKYPGTFEPFKIKKDTIFENQRDKRPLMPYEFILMLDQLVKTRKRGFVHLALDLMIMYQSGLRFPSSY